MFEWIIVGLISGVRSWWFLSPPSGLREALGASAPVDHLNLIDLVTGVVGGGQARRFTDGAVHIGRISTDPTDHVVVIVIASTLIECRRPGKLNAPDDALFGQDTKGIVHRLSRDGADVGTNVVGDVVRRSVGPRRKCSHDCQTLRRDLQTVFAKEALWVVEHPLILRGI
jgi:hypothetical protein